MLKYGEFILQIIICFILSFCIGFERQYRRRSVDLRTIILVSIGSFLFVSFSFAFPESDLTRIAAQVVAGIGFIGAGVILKDGKTVKGLTTAATLWCASAIGILCSANLLVEASIGTFFILFTNIIFRSINSKIDLLSKKNSYHNYSLSIICNKGKVNEIVNFIKDNINSNLFVDNFKIYKIEKDYIKIELFIVVLINKNKVLKLFIENLLLRQDILEINISDVNKSSLFDNEEL